LYKIKLFKNEKHHLNRRLFVLFYKHEEIGDETTESGDESNNITKHLPPYYQIVKKSKDE
jgi:hypothetical protein